jgi:hypothetical protein
VQKYAVTEDPIFKGDYEFRGSVFHSEATPAQRQAVEEELAQTGAKNRLTQVMHNVGVRGWHAFVSM